MLEAAAARGPSVEGSHRARLPDRHLVALAELRRRVTVQHQRLRKRRARVRPDRVVARRRSSDLGDPAHPDGVMVTAREQRRPRRRAERRRVETVVPKPIAREPLGRRRRGRPTKHARGGEAGIIEQHDQDVRSVRRWPQGLDRRELRLRILRIERHLPFVWPIGDRQLFTRRLTVHRMILSTALGWSNCLRWPSRRASVKRHRRNSRCDDPKAPTLRTASVGHLDRLLDREARLFHTKTACNSPPPISPR